MTHNGAKLFIHEAFSPLVPRNRHANGFHFVFFLLKSHASMANRSSSGQPAVEHATNAFCIIQALSKQARIQNLKDLAFTLNILVAFHET